MGMNIYGIGDEQVWMMLERAKCSESGCKVVQRAHLMGLD